MIILILPLRQTWKRSEWGESNAQIAQLDAENTPGTVTISTSGSSDFNAYLSGYDIVMYWSYANTSASDRSATVTLYWNGYALGSISCTQKCTNY